MTITKSFPASVRFLGKPTIAHRGPMAAIISSAVAQDVLRAVYKQIPPGSRQNMLLAKRWNVWAVLATEEWARVHARLTKPPGANGGRGKVAGSKLEKGGAR